MVRPSCFLPLSSVRPHEQDVVGEVRLRDPRLLPVDDVAPVLRTALQRSAPTSEPASGSDIAIASTRPFTNPAEDGLLLLVVAERS